MEEKEGRLVILLNVVPFLRGSSANKILERILVLNCL